MCEACWQVGIKKADVVRGKGRSGKAGEITKTHVNKGTQPEVLY
jgi:hypothetical protein